MDVVTLVEALKRVVINPLLLLLFSVGMLVFVWGFIEFLWGLNQDTSDKKTEGKWHMLWGVVGMFIMVAAYAIVQLIGTTVGTPLIR
jgi:hypothetical protein